MQRYVVELTDRGFVIIDNRTELVVRGTFAARFRAALECDRLNSEQQAQYALQPDGTMAPAPTKPTQTPEQHQQDRLFTADPTIRGQLNMKEVDHP